MSAIEKYLRDRIAELDKEDQLAIKDGNIDRSITLSGIKCELQDALVVVMAEVRKGKVL